MKKIWGILGAILWLFGLIEPANSTVIGVDDFTKNCFFETPKVYEHSSNALRHSNFKQKQGQKKKDRQNRASPATSNVVTNGNFTNGLVAWAITNPSNFPYGITAVDIDGSGPLSVSDAFFVKTGGGSDATSVSISQRITIPVSGEYTLFANIASSYFPTDNSINNLSGGFIKVTLNGGEIDSFDFGEIARNTWEYATLNASFLAASSGILDINFFRPFTVDPNSPVNYLDNVSLALNNNPGNPVPEPVSMLLFSTGAVVFGGYIRRQSKKR